MLQTLGLDFTQMRKRETAINCLRNRYTVLEESYIEVESRATKKKNKQKGFRVHNTRSGSRLPD